MGIVLVILSACAGYFFLTNTYYFKYSTARKNGQQLYLMSIFCGVLFLILGWFLLPFVQNLSYPEAHALRAWDKLDMSMLMHIGLWLIFSCGISVLIGNQIIKKEEAVWRAFQQDDLSKVIMRSLSVDLPILVTLDSRKAYVGYVTQTPEPREDMSFLSFMPVFSGYRTEDSLDLVLTNSYLPSINKFVEEKDSDSMENLSITVPRSKILSCNIFDQTVYESIENGRT